MQRGIRDVTVSTNHIAVAMSIIHLCELEFSFNYKTSR